MASLVEVRSNTSAEIVEEDPEENNSDNEEGSIRSLQSKLTQPYECYSYRSGSRQQPQGECLSEAMAREIKKKAEIRAQRVEDTTNPLRMKAFQEHRLRVKTAKAFVDTSNPMDGKTPYRNNNYRVRLLNFAKIERENAIMLRHLAEIIHGRGSLDCRWQQNKFSGSTISANNKAQTRQLRLLKITFENLTLLKRIQTQKPFYSRREQLTDYSRHEQIMSKMSVYPLFWQLDKECKYGAQEARARQNAERNSKPKCFLTFGNSEELLGRVVIELFAQDCPLTCENFRGLCTGEYGPSFKCSTLHRVVKDLLWQGGDVTRQGGSGSKSIYGDSFPDENFKIKHDQPGIITMANLGPNTNGSQFIIIAKKLSVLDGTNVAFGKVTSGLDMLKKLFNETTPTGRPKKKIFVVDCGEADGDDDNDDDGGDTEGEEDQTSGSQANTEEPASTTNDTDD